MTISDPLVDLDALPPEVVEPIRAWVDQYRNTARFERGIRLFGIQLTIHSGRRGMLIRASELKAVFTRHAELAEASARAMREQTDELAAENELLLAKGRKGSLKGRLLAATRSEARATQRLHHAQAEAREQVARELNDLAAQNAALLAHVDDLLSENKWLSGALKKQQRRRT